MITPLYDLGHTTATVTVAAPGAAANDTNVPVEPLADPLPTGTILDFGASKFAKLSAAAAVNDAALSTEPIPAALVAGDTATVPLAVANPLLADKFAKLSPDKQTAEQITAELLLDLRAPVYTGDDAEELKYAIVLQINYQLERPDAIEFMKADGNAVPGSSGVSRQYRDRIVSPQARAIVERVTGVRQVRLVPAGV